MIALKLSDGIVSPVCLKALFLFTNEKNLMGAHMSSLHGDGSFGHPGQMSKWMDLRVSQILYTLFDQCDI